MLVILRTPKSIYPKMIESLNLISQTFEPLPIIEATTPVMVVLNVLDVGGGDTLLNLTLTWKLTLVPSDMLDKALSILVPALSSSLMYNPVTRAGVEPLNCEPYSPNQYNSPVPGRSTIPEIGWLNPPSTKSIS